MLYERVGAHRGHLTPVSEQLACPAWWEHPLRITGRASRPCQGSQNRADTCWGFCQQDRQELHESTCLPHRTHPNWEPTRRGRGGGSQRSTRRKNTVQQDLPMWEAPWQARKPRPWEPDTQGVSSVTLVQLLHHRETHADSNHPFSGA